MPTLQRNWLYSVEPYWSMPAPLSDQLWNTPVLTALLIWLLHVGRMTGIFYVPHGWNGYQNKSLHRKTTPEKNILLLLLLIIEPATFWSCSVLTPLFVWLFKMWHLTQLLEREWKKVQLTCCSHCHILSDVHQSVIILSVCLMCVQMKMKIYYQWRNGQPRTYTSS